MKELKEKWRTPEFDVLNQQEFIETIRTSAASCKGCYCTACTACSCIPYCGSYCGGLTYVAR